MITRRWGRLEATAGAVGAVALLVATAGFDTWVTYLAIWCPLLAAVIVARYRRYVPLSGADLRAPVRFRITWMDLLAGVFVGLSLRGFVMIVELLSVGYITSSSSMFDVNHSWGWLVTAILFPGLFAPVVEELYFRGLVLPAIGLNWIGIVCSAVIFSALHLVTAFHPLIATSTFVVGITLGLLAVRTGRLGASIAAHVAYNASLIAMSELGGLASFAGSQ